MTAETAQLVLGVRTSADASAVARVTEVTADRCRVVLSAFSASLFILVEP